MRFVRPSLLVLAGVVGLSGCPISARGPADASSQPTGDVGAPAPDGALPASDCGVAAGADAATPPDAAYAGPDQTVRVGASVQLDSTGSLDPTNGVLAFAWSFRSKPGGSTAALGSATDPKPTFTADKAGVYVVELTVDNGLARSAPDAVLVWARTSATLPEDPAAPAKIVVADQVLQGEVEPIGMNLTHLTGGANFATNQHFCGTGFEPTVMRRLFRIDRAGEDAEGQWLEWDGGGGIHG